MTHDRRSVLVMTVVHHPDDARIRHRQLPALLGAGWEVTYAAPFTGYGLVVPEPTGPADGLRYVDVVRARGRRRIRARAHARRILQQLGPRHDVILLHDPELLSALPARLRARAVWDVHEDTAAAFGAKPWLPRPFRSAGAALVRRGERWAERHLTLILAEYGYQSRFVKGHAVIPNTVPIPRSVQPPTQSTVIYLGTITLERGAREILATARILRERTDGAVTTHVIGPAHGAAAPLMRSAHERGEVNWHGFVPNDRAREMLDGALAGLCLLQDLPNYRHSMPTKILEYMAHGVPVITTPLPLASEAVTEADAGITVPFEDPVAATKAVLALREDADRAAALGAAGHRAALDRYDWSQASEAFVQVLAGVAAK